MRQIGVFFLLIITLIMAMLLALLGVETLTTNFLGWFLLLMGVVYIAGVGILYFIRRERFWVLVLEWTTNHEERNDSSLWFIILGLSAAFYLSPLEFLLQITTLPHDIWFLSSGVVLVISGIALFIWARRILRRDYFEHTLVESGPYRFIRNPAYAGYFLIALGVSLGYSSLAGLASVIVLLLPSLVYRMKLEEKWLSKHYSTAYHEYLQRTKRLIPGIW